MCTGFSLAALASATKVVSFLADFPSSWPEMFCYYPQGRLVFEALVLAPLLVSALFLVGGVASHRLQSSLLDWALFGLGLVALMLLARVWRLIILYGRATYDAGCGHTHAWFGRHAVLDLFTRPYAGYVVCGSLLLLIVATVSREARRSVA